METMKLFKKSLYQKHPTLASLPKRKKKKEIILLNEGWKSQKNTLQKASLEVN